MRVTPILWNPNIDPVKDPFKGTLCAEPQSFHSVLRRAQDGQHVVLWEQTSVPHENLGASEN